MNKMIQVFLLIAVSLLSFVSNAQSQSHNIRTYYHNNLLGSPVAVTDKHAIVQQETVYYSYGDYVIDKSGNEKSGAWYTSKPRDEGTGLTYLNARHYDPVIGRFMSVDPVTSYIGGANHFNSYVYAYNNPYRYTDPTGDVPVDTVVDAGFVLYDIGRIGFGFFTGNSQMVADGTVDLLSDGAAMFVPYLPAGGSRITRAAADKAADVNATPKVPDSVDYSVIKNPSNVAEGKNFTLRQKQEALELNKVANGGVVESDLSGTPLVKPQKSKRGITPDPNEWQFDHIQPKSCGGTNCSSNLQILSRQENRSKSNN